MNPRIILAFLLSWIAFCFSSAAQVCDSNAFAPDSVQICADGQVRAALKVGNRMFITGDFRSVGRYTGTFIGLDTVTGSAQPVDQATWPKVSGAIYTSLPDGSGGWFLGGEFSLIGDSVRSNFAHITSTGQVSGFAPAANGTVRGLSRSGNILYMCGAFTAIGSSSRNHVAAFDLSTGLITSWNPNCNANVNVIAADGTTVWIGGRFTTVGSSTRNRIAAIDSATAAVLSQDPNASDSVNAIIVSGSTVFIGGRFAGIGGVTCRYLAAIDKSTGSRTAWNCQPSGEVFTLLEYGSELIVGGEFSFANSWATPREGAFMVSKSTGALNPISFKIGSGKVHAMSVSGNTLYVGGVDAILGSGFNPRFGIAAYSLSTGDALAYAPQVGSPRGYTIGISNVMTLQCYGGRLYAGGLFSLIGGKARNGLAAIDLSTNTVDPWTPSSGTPAGFNTLATANNKLYAGGTYGVQCYDLTSGAVVASWAPPLTFSGVSDGVKTLLTDSIFVYIGGEFRTMIGSSLWTVNLIRVDTLSGAIDNWYPLAGTVFSPVRNMLIYGSKLYVNGVNMPGPSTTRIYMNSYQLPGGTVYSNESSAYTVTTFPGNLMYTGLARAGNKIVLSGIFTHLNGAARPGLGAMNIASSNSISAWSPSFISDGCAGTSVVNDRRIFTTFLPTTASVPCVFAVFDTGSNSRLYPAWKPTTYTPPFGSLALSADSFYAYGAFKEISGRSYCGLVRFHLSRYPSLAVSIATPSSTVCAGNPVTFTAAAGSGLTYQWKKNGVNVGSSTNTYTYVPANGDSVRCVVTTATGACYNTNATTASSNTILMTVTPSVVPSVTIASSDTSVCTGTRVHFKATAVNGGSAPAYQWKRNNAVIGTNADTFSYVPANNDAIICELNSSAVCPVPATVTSNAITIVVSPMVTPAVSIAVPGGSVCSGSQVTATATPVNGGTLPVYQWSLNGLPAGTNSATYTFTPANGDTIRVVMTSNACTLTPTVQGNAIGMSVIPSVPTAVAISASDTSACAGATVVFSAAATNGGSSPGFQWTVNGTGTGSGSSTFSYTPVNGDTVRCVMSSNAVCASPATLTSAGIIMQVAPMVTPAVTVSAAPGTAACLGIPIVFSAAVVGAGNGPVYRWMLNGISVGTNTGTYTRISPAGGDIVSCTMISNAPCRTTDSATGVASAIVIYPSLVPVISFDGTTLDANIASGTYTWFLDGHPIAGATGKTHIPTATGTYVVRVVDNNGCEGSSAPFSLQSLSVGNQASALVSYYPNPAHSDVGITAPFPVMVRVSTMEGKVLLTAENVRTIDISRLPDGLYMIRIFDTGGKLLKTGRLTKLSR